MDEDLFQELLNSVGTIPESCKETGSKLAATAELLVLGLTGIASQAPTPVVSPTEQTACVQNVPQKEDLLKKVTEEVSDNLDDLKSGREKAEKAHREMELGTQTKQAIAAGESPPPEPDSRDLIVRPSYELSTEVAPSQAKMESSSQKSDDVDLDELIQDTFGESKQLETPREVGESNRERVV